MPVPSIINAGETLTFSPDISGYPATAYSLAFILNREGTLIANIAATAVNVTDFLVTADAATTAAWTPGRCNWGLQATKTADTTKTLVCEGMLSIMPNLGVSLTPSPSQVQLALIDASLSTLMASPETSVSFNGQSFSQRDIKQLMDIRDRLQNRVWWELRQLGLSDKGGARIMRTQFFS